MTARTPRLTALGALVVGTLLLPAPSAMGSFHLMKVREVRPATDAPTNDGFIELQMWQPGQNSTAGHSVTVYDAAGTLIRTSTLPNVMNGANQSTILIGEASPVGGQTPDVVDPLLDIPTGGGGVCFPDGGPPDCVTWGTFTEPMVFPDSQTMKAAAPAAGLSLTRSIGAGCSTLLEDADDTDDSSTDFAVTAVSPRPNSTAPTETDCVLTVNLAGGGVGSVGSSPSGIMCPSDCSQSYTGQVVTLTPTATGSTGSQFGGWTGCDSLMMSQCQMTMTMSKSVTAVFDGPAMPELTVMLAGTGTGTVAGSGINCGSNGSGCMATYPSGSPVSLTATPDAGSTFSGWTGCPAGAASNPCNYNADIHRTITANFGAGNPPTMNPPPVVVPITPATTPTAPKKCKKGFVKRKGKCRKKRK